MKCIPTALFLLISTFVYGQGYTWGAQVLDQESKSPLVGVNVFDIGQGIGASSNSKGSFSIEITKWPVQFKVSYLGYKTREIQANNSDELPLKIILSLDQNRLDEVVISDKAIPSKVTSKWKSVTDFILLDDRILYVETGGNARASKIHLSNLDGDILNSIPVKDLNLFEGLFLSCLETPYLICEYVAIQLDLSTDEILLQFESDIKDFQAYVSPCKASNDTHLFHGKRSVNSELATITQVDMETYERTTLTKVFDADQLEATQRSYALIELYSHFAKHTNNPFYSSIIATESYHLEIFRKPVDYDVFTSGDYTLVMDHENSKIAYFDKEAQHVKDVSIYYNQEKNWKGIVRQDHSTEKIYVIIEDKNSLILHQLDINNGDLNFIAYLDVDMVDKIDIHEKSLWYTASKLTGPQIGKRLYKLAL